MNLCLCFSFEGQYSILKSLISTCVLSYIGSREYWLFDRSQRVIKRRASSPCSSRTLVPLFRGLGCPPGLTVAARRFHGFWDTKDSKILALDFPARPLHKRAPHRDG